jgi:pimeloyl-ACP methyl ester carboxylesterase
MRLHTRSSNAHRLLQQIAARYPARDLETEEPPQLSPVSERDLRRLDMPTLILTGALDSELRRSTAAQLAQVLPNTRLEVIADAGHLSALDNPETYVEVLHEFFSSQPALAAGGVT